MRGYGLIFACLICSLCSLEFSTAKASGSYDVDVSGKTRLLNPVGKSQEVLVIHICDYVPGVPHTDSIMSLLEILPSMEHSISLIGRGHCFHANRKKYSEWVRKHARVHVEQSPSLLQFQELVLDRNPFIDMVIFVGEENYTPSPAVDFLLPVVRQAIPSVRVVYWTPGFYHNAFTKVLELLRLYKDVLDSDGLIAQALPKNLDDLLLKESSLLDSAVVDVVGSFNRGFARDIGGHAKVLQPALPLKAAKMWTYPEGKRQSAFVTNETLQCSLIGFADQRNVFDRLAWRRFIDRVWPLLPQSCVLTIGFVDEAVSVNQLLGPGLSANHDVSRIRTASNIFGKAQRNFLLSHAVAIDYDSLSPTSRFRSLYPIGRRMPFIFSPVAYEKFSGRVIDTPAMSTSSLPSRSDRSVPVLVAEKPELWVSMIADLLQMPFPDRQRAGFRLHQYALENWSFRAAYDQWAPLFSDGSSV